MTHLDHDWHSPVWRHWLVELSRGRGLVRYDERGCGLSDWGITPPTLDAWLHDLETVVDAAGLDRFDLLGVSQGGSVALAYAAKYPHRVRKVVLYGAFDRGWLVDQNDETVITQYRIFSDAARIGWGRDDPWFRQLFTSRFMPGGSRELWEAFNDLQKTTTTPEIAAQILDMCGRIDVTVEAAQVRAPTLILHGRDDQVIDYGPTNRPGRCSGGKCCPSSTSDNRRSSPAIGIGCRDADGAAAPSC
jgi:pimeloyl-ACP methyl ester carboxylesterase